MPPPPKFASSIRQKMHTPPYHCHFDFFLFITTSFEMSETDMEKGADAQTLSAEIFEIFQNFWILTDHLL